MFLLILQREEGRGTETLEFPNYNAVNLVSNLHSKQFDLTLYSVICIPLKSPGCLALYHKESVFKHVFKSS